MKVLGWPFKIIFNRLTLTIILTIVEIILIFLAFQFFYNYIAILYGGITILNLLTVASILISDENSNYKIIWILLVMGVPVVGIFTYFIFRLQVKPMVLNEKLFENKKESLKYIKQDEDVLKSIDDKQLLSLTHYMNNYAYYPTYYGSDIKYFPFGEDKFTDLLIELSKAKKFIFLEYFIIAKGELFDLILEVLKRKVKEGVEVRILYDGTCPFFKGLTNKYVKILKSYGIKAKMFLPVKATISTYQNNRDHRKIVVIDGRVAYTGGVNIADEYANKKIRFGVWKDTGIKITGNGVNSFTAMFLEMWNIDTEKNEEYASYMIKQKTKYDGYVIPYSDNPLDNERVGRTVYMEILNNAKEYVYITTPYLILDDELLNTIKYTAKRGVDVRIMMPHIPDKKIVYMLGRSYYEELINSNVKIYEYEPGFIHAKMFISDDDKAVVGTINLDYRSLYMNFECGCYIYKNKIINTIKEDFEDILNNSIAIDKNNVKKYGLIKKIFGIILRFFAPLM